MVGLVVWSVAAKRQRETELQRVRAAARALGRATGCPSKLCKRTPKYSRSPPKYICAPFPSLPSPLQGTDPGLLTSRTHLPWRRGIL
ncbi:hypothetical protein XELAEV_18020490mg [Xenopus laevis]|uniref:Uncharacterized protein n=1 Tax=Xenopus laevis TaxID=8355 RepID=A0A974D9H3_XENLA|nr:hypothetical protein XELAEV_18020490mg [Xenopus laevis]